MPEPLFTVKLDAGMSADELGEIEAQLERALCVVSAARAAILELEEAQAPAQNGYRLEGGA